MQCWVQIPEAKRSAVSAWWNPGHVRGPVTGQGQQHAGEQGADQQLAGADADRQEGLDPARDVRAVDDLLQPGERDRRAHRVPPSRATARVSSPGSRGGDQVAEALGAGDPGGVHEGGQAEVPGTVAQPAGPQPAGVQPGQVSSPGE